MRNGSRVAEIDTTRDPRAALVFAREYHGAQRYGKAPNDVPYEAHLEAVAEVLRRFGYGNDGVLMSAAYLHDVIEDTCATRAELAERFGTRIADIVDAVSDPPGASRAERKAAAYPRIAGCEGAVIVKLADRIANVEAGGPMVDRYRAEQASFRAALQRDGVADEMWRTLNAELGAPESA